MKKERIIELFANFVENEIGDLETADIREKLRDADATDAEIEELGFGYCLDTEEDEDDEDEEDDDDEDDDSL